MNHDTVPAVASEKPYNRGLLITGLIIAMLFAALDGTIVGTAMPRIVGELGGIGLMTWLTTAYMLTSTTVVPIAGKLADLFGRRVIYVTGLLIFMLASALCGIAGSMISLIVYRGLQGIGGGVMMPMAMIIIGDIFTGKERAKWQGVFGGLFGLSSIIGPQVGGWIVDALNWRWVFYINLPVGVVAVIFIALGLKKHQSTGPVKIDIPGIFALIVGVVSLLLALSIGGTEFAWLSWQIIGLLATALIALAAFVVIETRSDEPVLPMYLFKNHTFTVLNGISFFMSVGMFGAIMFVPFFMQGIVGVTPTESGTIMVPMMLTMMFTSFIGGHLVYKLGVKTQIVAGMAVCSCGFYFLTTMGLNTSKLTATLYMMILGLGIGLVMPIITLALQESFPKSALGVVTSSSQFFRSIGGTFGVAALGAVMNQTSGALMTKNLVPVLNELPPQAAAIAAELTGMIHDNPQSIYSMLFDPHTLQSMPPGLVQAIVPIMKNSLIISLRDVFIGGMVFVVLGALLALALRKIRLVAKKKEEQSAEQHT